MTKKPESWEARLGVSSFDPLDVMALADAVKARKDTVELHGLTFKLRYQDNKVHYSPERGYIPCGWVDIEKLGEGI